MNILDYTLAIGNKQGNTKHFKNFLKIHSKMMKLERENETAKRMINAKNDLLIHKEQKEIELKKQISGLKIELSKLKALSDNQQRQIDNLIEDKTKNF
jgi:seryl-tRNA synthetase